MRLDWIEDILAVADSGSFNSAAEARFLTPSAFTRRIRGIEELLGCELFERSKRPITLKSHVRECLPELRDAAVLLRRARQLLSDPHAHKDKRVTMVCQHALAAFFAPRLMSGLEISPAPQVRFKAARKSECLLQLIRRKAEFALIYEALGSEPDIDEEYCQRIDLGKEEFLPVIHSSYKLNPIEERPLKSLPMIGFPSSIFLGEVLQNALAAHQTDSFELEVVAESGLSYAVFEFVKSGVGVGWLPRPMIEDELCAKRLTSLENSLPKFELNVVLIRLSPKLPTVAEKFWTAMQETNGVGLFNEPDQRSTMESEQHKCKGYTHD
jgi:DNA-binding transcriptional LysR family regulator